MPDPAVLAVDVGGTTVKSALVDSEGRFLTRHVASTARGREAEAAVRSSVGELVRRAAHAGVPLAGVGVVSPGIIDVGAGVVRYASNLGWTDVPLRDLVADVVAAPVAVGHDARTAGEAEGLLGAARGRRHYVHVSIGTGIAAALVVDGTSLNGSAGGAGELGHTPVRERGEPCPCGQLGCLEVYASGAGLARRYERLAGRSATAAEIVGMLGGDPVARQVWDDAVDALAAGLTTCAMLLEPEMVILAGGVALAGEALVGPVRTALDERLTWRRTPAVEASALGTDAAILGAALLGMRAGGLAPDGGRGVALPSDS